MGDLPRPDHPSLSDHPDQVTPRIAAGDAIVVDYRLLHGTHANSSEARRDCVVLNFAPAWRELPEDIRAHLVRHPAQPNSAEACAVEALSGGALLPRFEGVPRDLPLTRFPPRRFEIPL